MSNILKKYDKSIIKEVLKNQKKCHIKNKKKVTSADITTIKNILKNKYTDPHEMQNVLCLFDLILYYNTDNSPILFNNKIVKWLKHMKKLNVKSAQGYVYISDIFQKNIQVIIKCSQYSSDNFNNELLREYFIGISYLNKLRYKTPIFMYTLGLFKCSEPILDSKNNVKLNTFCKENKNLKNFIIYEKIDGYSFKENIKNYKLTSNMFFNILSQILLGLEIAQRDCGFCHFDLHWENIILRPISKEIRYNLYLNNSTYEITANKYIPTIIDYGYSSININIKNKKYFIGSRDFPEYGMMNFLIPCFDMYKLLYCTITLLYDYSGGNNSYIQKKIYFIFKNFFKKDPYNIFDSYGNINHKNLEICISEYGKKITYSSIANLTPIMLIDFMYKHNLLKNINVSNNRNKYVNINMYYYKFFSDSDLIDNIDRIIKEYNIEKGSNIVNKYIEYVIKKVVLKQKLKNKDKKKIKKLLKELRDKNYEDGNNIQYKVNDKLLLQYMIPYKKNKTNQEVSMVTIANDKINNFNNILKKYSKQSISFINILKYRKKKINLNNYNRSSHLFQCIYVHNSWKILHQFFFKIPVPYLDRNIKNRNKLENNIFMKKFAKGIIIENNKYIVILVLFDLISEKDLDYNRDLIQKFQNIKKKQIEYIQNYLKCQQCDNIFYIGDMNGYNITDNYYSSENFENLLTRIDIPKKKMIDFMSSGYVPFKSYFQLVNSNNICIFSKRYIKVIKELTNDIIKINYQVIISNNQYNIYDKINKYINRCKKILTINLNKKYLNIDLNTFNNIFNNILYQLKLEDWSKLVYYNNILTNIFQLIFMINELSNHSIISKNYLLEHIKNSKIYQEYNNINNKITQIIRYNNSIVYFYYDIFCNIIVSDKNLDNKIIKKWLKWFDNYGLYTQPIKKYLDV